MQPTLMLALIALLCAPHLVTGQPAQAPEAAAETPLADPSSGEMLVNGDFANGNANWVVEQIPPATAKAEFVKDGPGGKPAVRLEVLTIADAAWHLQLHSGSLSVQKGREYTFSFWAKSDRAGDITVNCMQNHEPWAHPTQQVVAVSPEWARLEYAFVSAWDDDNVRVGFTNLATTPGQVYWFADCSLKATSAAPATAKPSAPAAPAAARAAQPAGPIVVWDGETAQKGSGWVNPPATCIIGPQTAEAHSGTSAVEFKFKGDGTWLGAGWNWCTFEPGLVGTDITALKNLTFWVKSKGTVSDLQLNLLCGGEVWDTPEHHTEKVSVLKYCPDLQDGNWHQVTIPLADLTQPPSFDARNVGELQVFNAGAGDGGYFFDDITFE